MGADLELRYFDDALNGVLKAGLPIDGISSDQIAWPEKTFVPTKGIPYLKPELAARVRRPVGFGADSVKQWDGTWQIGIFVPRDTGTRLMNAVASIVIRTYPRGLRLTTPQGLTMSVTNSTAPVPVSFGDWVNLPVQIEWFAFEPP